MPNARVGAMPQPSQDKRHHNNDQHGRGGMGHQSGITMEDLKKQTAMRLMAAQQQERHFQGANAPRDGCNSPYSHGYDPRCGNSGYNPYPRGHAASSHPNSRNMQQGPFQRGRSPQTILVHQDRLVGKECHSAGNSEDASSTTSTSSVAVDGNGANLNSHAKEGPQPHFTGNSKYERRHHKQHYEQVPQQPGPTASRPHHKLPHGLTVQELKEMTKARLAAEAEAAERNEAQQGKYASAQSKQYGQNHRSQQQYNHRHKEHIQNHSYQSHSFSHATTRDVSRRNAESPSLSTSHEALPGSTYHNPYPHHRERQEDALSSKQIPYSSSSSDRASPSWRRLGHGSPEAVADDERQHLHPHQHDESEGNRNKGVSSGGSGAQSLLPPTHKQFPENSCQKQGNEYAPKRPLPSFDALETASVTSHASTVASEYLGSDSPFRSTPNQAVSPYLSSSGSGSGNPSGNSGLFGRSRSYPSGCNIGNALESTSFETVVSPSSFSDVKQSGTRSVVSPLQVWSAQEDRTITRTLTLPLFESSSFGTSLEVEGSPSYSREPTPTERQRAYSSGMDSIDSNPYVAKFVPLPCERETEAKFDESTKDQPLNPIPLSASNRGQSGHGEIPNWVAESVLVTPQREARKVAMNKLPSSQAVVSNKGSVFRNTGDVRTQQFSSQSPSVPDAPISDISNAGANSWAGPSPEIGVHLGSSSFGGLGSLPEDFGSALSLHSTSFPAGVVLLNDTHEEQNFAPSPLASILHSVAAKEETSFDNADAKELLSDAVARDVGTEGTSSSFSVKNFFKSSRVDNVQKDRAPGRKRRDGR